MSEIVNEQPVVQTSSPIKRLKPEKKDKPHNVGQMDHNLYKLKRVSEKSGYPAVLDSIE